MQCASSDADATAFLTSSAAPQHAGLACHSVLLKCVQQRQRSNQAVPQCTGSTRTIVFHITTRLDGGRDVHLRLELLHSLNQADDLRRGLQTQCFDPTTDKNGIWRIDLSRCGKYRSTHQSNHPDPLFQPLLTSTSAATCHGNTPPFRRAFRRPAATGLPAPPAGSWPAGTCTARQEAHGKARRLRSTRGVPSQ